MSSPGAEPVAIVGIGCRFPGANGPAEFWELIRSGGFAVRDVPEHRVELGFNIHEVYDPRPGMPGRIGSPRYGFLDHPELFDPLPFGLTPRDAAGMEPQQRLVVEVVWDALQDAGIPADSLDGERVAVMIGHMAEDYSREQIAVLGEERYRNSIDVWAAAGIARAAVSGRVSFLLGAKGPSFTVDTACSSSLLTVHLACQSLWSGESSYAIAGGVNVFLSPEGMIALSRVGMLARDGRCKAFDDRADGFVRSEGAGVVVLRPLADALAANDPIYAVLRGTGFSADGRDGGHMMAPGRFGQVQAMRDAYARAGVDPSTVDFVEAHGTGTPIGDPVEIQALADVMGPGRAADRPLRVSSVKGNIGHAESASGIAGLIKAALSVHHRALPRQLHFETPSRAIPWDEVPIRVQTRHEPWPEGRPLRVAVNSFGISGTNAHAILDPPPLLPVASDDPGRGDRSRLFVLSGHSRDALCDNASHLARWLHEHGTDGTNGGETGGLRDLAYTLARRRMHRGHRLSVVASTPAALAEELEAFAAGTPGRLAASGRCERAHHAPVAMVFSGHGSHWRGMGLGLYEREPVFREALDAWDAALRPHVDWSLLDVLRAAPSHRGAGGDGSLPVLERVDVLQSAVVGIAIALARLWQSAGIRPSRVAGHSVGEIAAAHVAGCLGLADAARVACERGRAILEHAGRGAMGVVAWPADAVAEECANRRERDGDRVWVAGENAPSLTIVSGDVAAVARLLADLEARGAFARALPVEYASHCPSMDVAGERLARALDGISPAAGELPFVSTVTGGELDGRSLDAAYWGRNLRAPVLLTDGVGCLLAKGAEALLEVSPHPVLASALGEIATSQAAGGAPAAVFSSLRREEDEEDCWLASLGGLFAHGCAVDFAVTHPTGRVVRTPLYAYQRREFWFAGKRGARVDPARQVFAGLLGVDARKTESSSEPGRCYWQIELDSDSFGPERARTDERGGLVVPEGELARMALRAAGERWAGGAGALEAFRVERPLARPTGPLSLQIEVDGDDESARFRIASRAAGDASWTTHATGRVWRRETAATSGDDTPRALPRAEAGADVERRVEPDALGERVATLGMTVGEEHRCITRATISADAAVAWVAPEPGMGSLLDAAFELLARSAARAGSPRGGLRPLGIDDLSLDRDPAGAHRVRLTLRPGEDGHAVYGEPREGHLVADAEVLARDGAVIARVRGLRAARVAPTPEELAVTCCVRRWSALDQPRPAQSLPGSWAVFGNHSALCAELRLSLEAAGQHCLALASVSEPVEPVEPAELVASLEALVAEQPERAPGVVYAFAGAPGDASAGALDTSDRILRSLADVRELIEAKTGTAPVIWIATRGTQAPGAGEASFDPCGALLWERVGRGLPAVDAGDDRGARVPIRCVDLPSGSGPVDRAALGALLVSDLGEGGVALRCGELLAPRFEPLPAVEPAPARSTGSTRSNASPDGRSSSAAKPIETSARPFAVCVGDTDRLDTVELAEAALFAPAPHEVRVSVRAAGLSFLDVLATMGVGRAEDGEALGWECAGVVTAIGSDVHTLAVGDEVFGFARGAATSEVCTPASLLARTPAALDPERAAAVPLAEVVARHVLDRVARLRSGDRLVVHGAGGAIGQAIVSLAARRGARVVATAGSDRRRRAVLARGAEQVLDSRASQLVRALGRWAGEAGIDVVVDLAPAGSLVQREAIFDRLAPGARIVVLEQPNAPAVLPPRAAGPNGSLHHVDPIGLLESKPEEWTDLLHRVADEIARGALDVSAPTVFPVERATRAVRFMAQGRHAGKVVLSIDECDTAAVSASLGAPEAPSWLAGEVVILVGAETSPGRTIARLFEQAGARVARFARDEALARLTPAGLQGAVGLVWATDMVGSDGAEIVTALSDAALGACLQLAWLATGDSPGLAAADGADASVDALVSAEVMRAAASGAPVALVRVPEVLDATVDPARVLAWCEQIQGEAIWIERARGVDPDAHAWVRDLATTRQEQGSTNEVELPLDLASLDPEGRVEAVREVLAEALGRVLHLAGPPLEQIDWSAAPGDLGLDSLMALELKLVLESRIGRELELPRLFDGTRLGELAEALAEAPVR